MAISILALHMDIIHVFDIRFSLQLNIMISNVTNPWTLLIAVVHLLSIPAPSTGLSFQIPQEALGKLLKSSSSK